MKIGFTIISLCITSISLGAKITQFSDVLSTFKLSSNVSFYDRSTFFGFWHVDEKYGSKTRSDKSASCATGCKCDDVVLKCGGLSISTSSVVFIKQTFTYVNASSFPASKYKSVSTLQFISCTNMTKIESFVFDKFPNIQHLVITGTGLTHLPAFQGPFNSLLNIDFYSNEIEHIRRNYFSYVPNLQYLNLAGNKISYVADSAFENTNITFITLADNKLGFVPNSFRQISSTVEYIGLENNAISVISEVSFSDIESLFHLNISNNPITQIEYGAFLNCPALSYIEIHGSNISDLKAFSFQSIPELTYISLYKSPYLKSIAGNAFAGLPRLTVLLLQYCKLAKLDFRMLNDTAQLKYLILDSNSLTRFPHVMLLEAQLSNLQMLTLIKNKIGNLSEIEDDYFLNYTRIIKTKYKSLFHLNISLTTLPNLSFLDLSQNYLTGIPDYFFTALPNLRYLYLDRNRLDDRRISTNAFTGTCKTLGVLKMNNNDLQSVPSSIYRPPNLYSIDLGYNLLTYLEQGTFLSLTNLTYLVLRGNSILTIEDKTFPVSLRVLNLGFNNIDFLDENQFNNLPVLRYLDLSYNRISYLPNDVFANDTALTQIYLHHNNIGWISNKVFRDTPLTSKVVISYNKIRYIEHGTFTGKNFKYFAAQNNELSHLPDDRMFCDKTQTDVQIYLQDNQLEYLHSYVFCNISSIKYITLTGNLVTDIYSNAFYNIGLKLTIDLSKNPVNSIEGYSFNKISSLGEKSLIDLNSLSTSYTAIKSYTFINASVRNINLLGNNISRIEREAFSNVNILNILYMANINLNFIAPHAISGYVKEIYLQNNKLTRLTQGVFEKTQCSSLFLTSNEISFVDKHSLPNCTNQIILNNNRIPRLIQNMAVDGSALKTFAVKNNTVKIIETDALSSMKDSLTTLDLSDNRLPVLESGVIAEFSVLRNLLLSGNKIRHLKDQGTLGSLQVLIISDNDGKIKHFSKSILDALTGSVIILNTESKPLGCSCYNFKSFLVASTAKLLQFDNLDYCKSGDVVFSFNATVTNFYNNTNNNTILCEPVITKLRRKTVEWLDDLPETEKITVKWKLNEQTLWGNNNYTFCCTGSENKCLTVTQFIVQCFDDESDTVIEGADKVLQVNSLQECGFEFSDSFTIAYTASSVACAVQVYTAGEVVSAFSPFEVTFPEQNPTSVKITCTSKSFRLTTTYFDYDNNLFDFQNYGDDNIISSPNYSSHTFGPYLYKDSQNGSMSQWFTVNSNTSHVLQENICLEKDGKIYKWFARNWYPLDTVVPTDQLNRDKDYVAHNLYFTARSSFTFKHTSFNQEIWVGGPDDVWVYINGMLVLELLADSDDDAPLPCAKIFIFLKSYKILYGELDFSQDVSRKERCIATGESFLVSYAFTVGKSYPVDMFFTQRRSLYSCFYIELKQITPQDTPAAHYTYNLTENKPPGGLMAAVSLENNAGVTGPYQITIKAGEVYTRVENQDYQYKPDIQAAEPNTDPEENNEKQSIPDYYNCSDAVPDYSALSQQTDTTIPANSTRFLMIQVKKLDYDTRTESKRYFQVLLKVSFNNFNISYYYVTVMEFLITDSNDNCPVFPEYSGAEPIKYESVYALSVEGKQLIVTDEDSSVNQDITYYIGAVIRPHNESLYVAEVDYFAYEDVFVDYVLTVHAVDNGERRYGAAAEVLVHISTGCIRDIKFTINNRTGLLHVQAPGWMVSGYNATYCESCTVGYRCPGNGVRVRCGTCSQEYEGPGYTLPSGVAVEEAACQTPSAAEFSFGGASECEACKPGWICKDGLGSPVLEDKKYVKPCTNESCDETVYDCIAGYSCLGGVTEICAVGTYNDGTHSRCQQCSVGQYNNQTGAGSCVCCPEGTESTHGKAYCKYCSWNEVGSNCGLCRRCRDETECPCVGTAHGCAENQPCVNMPGNTNICLACPEGYEAADKSCRDIDECTRYSPCYDGVQCLNLIPGFKCDPCPSGYEGTSPEGIGQKEKQSCSDLDECSTDNGGCDLNSECINLPGSVKCGLCAAGLVGSGDTQCTSGDYCLLQLDLCSEHADCINTGPGAYACQCQPGYVGSGYYCGTDSDLDGYPDHNLNCNAGYCTKDNCPDIPNTGQEDTDGDEIGDSCDGDIDGDMVVNDLDTCPYDDDVVDTTDTDEDEIPNACDNCPDVYNPYQEDADEDGVGDHCSCRGAACYTDDTCTDTLDTDGDGIPDNCDNCPDIPNSLQADTDSDGKGDSCDDDIDGDGTTNASDNCVYLPNTDQQDTDGDGVGDLCDDSLPWPDIVNDADTDGDKIPDLSDTCPTNKDIQFSNFTLHQTVPLTSGQVEGVWLVRSKGRSVEQITEGAGPAVLLATDRFEDVDYNGTLYVRDTSTDNGYIGIVFSYQSPGKMYLVLWRRDYKTWLHPGCQSSCSSNHAKGGTTGVQLRAVHVSVDYTDKNWIESLLWGSSDSAVSSVLWQDPAHLSWVPGQAYRWFVSHRPSTGRMTVRIYSAGGALIVDSGPVYSTLYTGGRLGVFNFHQSQCVWANLVYKCAPPERYGLALSRSYLPLGTLSSLQLDRNCAISVWVKAGLTGATQPLLCARHPKNNLLNSTLCVYVDGALRLVATSDHTHVTHPTPLTTDRWYLVAVSRDYQNMLLTLYRNEDAVSVPLQNTGTVSDSLLGEQTLYVGTDLTNYFNGTISDIRLLNSLLLSPDLLTVLSTPHLHRQYNMGIVSAHLTFGNEELRDEFGNVQVTHGNTSTSTPPRFTKIALSGYQHALQTVITASPAGRKRRSGEEEGRSGEEESRPQQRTVVRETTRKTKRRITHQEL